MRLCWKADFTSCKRCLARTQFRFPAGLLLALTFAFSAGAQAQSPEQSIRRISLQTATEALIAKNLTVMAARYNVDLFRAQRVAAALRPASTVVLGANQFAIPRLLRQPHLLTGTDGDVAANSTYSIDIQKLIERGGKRQLRISQADIQTRVAEAQLANALREQIFELNQAFLSAILARENFRVVRENLRDFDRTEQLLTAQVKEGYSAGVDLRRIGLEVVEFQGDVSAAEQSFIRSLRDVFNLIGEGEVASLESPVLVASTQATAAPLPALDLIEGDLGVRPISIDVDALRKLALASRPDRLAAELEMEAANNAIRMAEAERVRDVTVGSQYARSGADNTVGVAVGVPLSTRARANAAIAQATAAKLQAEARLRRVRAQVLTDVEKALVAYRLSLNRLSLFDGRVLASAREVRDIEQVAYREGARGLISFLDAQRTYNKTLIAYNQARYDLALSIAQLELAVGAALTN
jgi:cobalt-zinc-cadmium efflux system outer membrane protein